MGNALENLYGNYKIFTDFFRDPLKVFSKRIKPEEMKLSH